MQKVENGKENEEHLVGQLKICAYCGDKPFFQSNGLTDKQPEE